MRHHAHWQLARWLASSIPLLSVMLGSGGLAHAGTVTGRIEIPTNLDRPPVVTRGFLDRAENPFAPVRPYNVTQQLFVVLEGDEKPGTPPQVVWDLVGESFLRPVLAVPAGAEVLIRDQTRTSRTLVATEDPKLVPAGPINPSGTKSFRVSDVGKTYTVGDPDAPHLRGTIVVVNTLFIAYPDETGKFDLADVPPGAYKIKIWYRNHWIERTDDTVTVTAKGKVDVNPKLPPGALALGAAGKK